ncbi:MAG: protein kinase domain-containing protein [Candidatus Xenobia bacterium]
MPTVPLEVPIDGYVMQTWLGEGAMGVVYRAFHATTERTVAIKLMAVAGEDPAPLTRFQREAATLARFSHPNIVGFVENGTLNVEGESLPYLAMEYLAGLATLDVAWEERTDESWLLDCFDQALCGLEAMHAEAVVHRDLKPQNLGVPGDGILRILDLGLSRRADDSTLTQSGMLVGTISYMSPEQVMGQVVDARSDLYSMGMVLLALLGGGHPLAERNLGEVALCIATGDIYHTPRPLAEPLNGYVRKLTAFQPDDRFASATEAREALQALRPGDGQARNLRDSLEHARSALQPRLPELRNLLRRTAGTLVGPASFVGREALLRQVQEELSKRRLVVLCGRAGMGKSAVAAQLLRTQQQQWPGIVIVSLRNPPERSLDTVATLLAQTLAEADAEALRQAWQQAHTVKAKLDLLLPQTRQRLIVLENLEEVLDESNRVKAEYADLGAFLERCLAVPDAARILVSSRRALVLPDAVEGAHGGHRVEIALEEGLSDGEAAVLLRALDEDGRLSLKTAPESLLQPLLEQAHGIPRTLEAIVATLRSRRTLTLARLAADRAALQRLAENPARELYEGLCEEEQRVVRVLALLQQPVPLEAVLFLCPNEPIEDLLEALVRNFVARFDRDMFSLSPLDAQFALTRLEEAEALPLHVRAAAFFHQVRTPREQWKTLQDLGPNLAEVRHLLAASRADQACVALGEIDTHWLSPRGYASMAVALRQQMVGRLRDDSLEQENAYRLGVHLGRAGNVETALQHLGQAKEIAEQRGDRQAVMEVTGSLGVSLGQAGQIEAAITHLEAAAGMAAEQGRVASEIRYRSYLSAWLVRRGRLAEAQEAAEVVLARSRSQQDKMALVDALTTAGHLAYSFGDLSRAEGLQREALREHDGDDLYRVALQGHLAMTLAYRGQVEEAAALMAEAQAVCRQREAAFWEFFCLTIRSLVAVVRGRPDEALAAQESAQTLLRTLPQALDLASCFTERSMALAADGQFEAALEAAGVALQGALQTESPQDDCDTRARCALLLMQLGRPSEAQQEATRALAAARALDIPRTLAWCQLAYGVAHDDRGSVEAAVATAAKTSDAWLRGQCALYLAWMGGPMPPLDNPCPVLAAATRLTRGEPLPEEPLLQGPQPAWELRVLAEGKRPWAGSA